MALAARTNGDVTTAETIEHIALLSSGEATESKGEFTAFILDQGAVHERSHLGALSVDPEDFFVQALAECEKWRTIAEDLWDAGLEEAVETARRRQHQQVVSRKKGSRARRGSDSD